MQRTFAVAATVLLTAVPALAADVIRADQLKLTLVDSIKKALEGHQVNNVNVGGHIFHLFPISKTGSVKGPKGFSANGTIQHRVKVGRNERVQYRITYRLGQEQPMVEYNIDGRGWRPPNPQRRGWEGSLGEILNTISDTLSAE